MERKIEVNKNLFEITEEYPSVISVLVNKGFSQLNDEAKRKSFGKQITLKQAAGLKNLDLEKLVDLMETEIKKNTAKSSSEEKIKVSGSLPCPVKIPMTEELEKITDELDYEVKFDLKSASQGLEWLQDGFAEIKSADELSDIFISAGFDLFFDKDLMDRFRRQQMLIF